LSEHVVHITDDTFDKVVLQADMPVLVDFWAEWCGPCKMIGPVLEDIAKEYTGRVVVAKLNIDQNSTTAPKYGIKALPSLLLFKNGNVEATKVGAASKSQLAAFLDNNL
jgi:thioredoxin 1